MFFVFFLTWFRTHSDLKCPYALTYCRKAEHSPLLTPSSLCSLLCPSEFFWLIVISWRALLSPSQGYCSNSKPGLLVTPRHLPSSPSASPQLSQRRGCQWCLLQAGHVCSFHWIPSFPLKALPLSGGWGLLISMGAFAGGGDMGRKGTYSAGGKEPLRVCLHCVCTAEVDTNRGWLCWRTLPGI